MVCGARRGNWIRAFVALSASFFTAGEFSELSALRDRLPHAHLAEWTAPIRARGVRCATEVVSGDPREVLKQAPETFDADLIVIGRQGPAGEPGLFHISSVAEYLVHHATVPLAVITRGASTKLNRIVVGVDGSANSHTAARWCAKIATATGAAVTAVHVHEPMPEWTSEPDMAGWHERTEEHIRKDLAVELTDAAVDLTPVAVRGRSPAAALLHHASGADLLVVGMRGTGGFLGLRAGGVAMSVLHAAECSVALIPQRED